MSAEKKEKRNFRFQYNHSRLSPKPLWGKNEKKVGIALTCPLVLTNKNFHIDQACCAFWKRVALHLLNKLEPDGASLRASS